MKHRVKIIGAFLVATFPLYVIFITVIQPIGEPYYYLGLATIILSSIGMVLFD